MPRRARYTIEGNLHHVWSGAVDGLQLFTCDEDREYILDCLDRGFEGRSARILNWVVPDTHFHTITIGPMSEVSSGLESALTRYAQYVQVRDGRRGHVFGSRFHAKPILSDEYLYRMQGYVPMNVVTAGQANTLDELRLHPWSGLPALLSDAPPKLSAHDVGAALKTLGTSIAAARAHLEAILRVQLREWAEAQRSTSPRAFLLVEAARHGVFADDVLAGDRSHAACRARFAAIDRCVRETHLRDGEIARALGVSRPYVTRIRSMAKRIPIIRKEGV